MKRHRQKDTFQFEEDPFSNVAQGIGKSMHEELSLKNFYRLSFRLKVQI